MKISAVESFILTDRRLLVRIGTDTDLVGWGEATLETWVGPVAAVVRQMSDYLVGQDPRRITAHWQVLTRGGFYRGGPVMSSAVSGIDQALWDLAGKRLGVPVHELLGGAVRSGVRLYGHANVDGRIGDPVRARALAAEGYTMVKVAPTMPTRFVDTEGTMRRLVDELEELRATIGDEVDIAVDLHGRFSIPQSRRFLARTEHVGLAFVEEPLRPEHSAHIGELVRSTSTPIATGERLYSRTEFDPVLRAGIAFAQPDLAHAGGISEVVRIGALAEVFDAQLAPHCPLGLVAFAACIQVDAATPNAAVQETVIDFTALLDGEEHAYVRNREDWMPVDGYLPVPQGVGLGLDIDEQLVRERAVEVAPSIELWWSDPRDGSYVEW
ncbi:galactonate dehydratase [Microbacterium oxydans]|uniref:D-galactonate dehydratase n=1 Tax=Microbacterium oxydans TaxID=82380 RepID=A0A0F0LD39_9MICO|nr:galactonate dehydratase [Microbacterium oxydans]KJL31058.1 D-galactonate dehydratase [Microbacterium oxydans]